MKTAKLIIGIISIVLSLFILFQSCAAGLSNAMASNGEFSGSAGVIVAICMIVSGIIGLATRNKEGRGGPITAGCFYLFAGLIGAVSAGSYSDLYIWAFVAFAFGAVYLISAFLNR